MKRNENTDTGEVSFHFNSDEWKKLKIAGIAAGLLLAASLGTAVYSAVSMESLSRQNQLYQNQLKMAEEKMKSLEDKTATIEKLSDQLQDMVKANSNGAAQNMTGGIGGASTVPDKAKTVAAKEQMTGTSYATPGSLLKSMRQLDATRYGHNSAILVTEGQQVEQGTILALVGSTGNSTGPHCHYEVRIHGDAVDPTYFLPGND